MAQYEPKTYPDDLILFKAQESSEDPGIVARLSAGKLHLHELPCRHDEIIRDLHVPVWANQLKSYLHKAQAIQRETGFSSFPKEDNDNSLSDQAIANRQESVALFTNHS